MRTLSTLFAAIGILLGNPAAHGMATSRVGPDSANKYPTAEQSDWPKGIVDLARHESRVYSVWVNGGENFYFKSDLKEINELIRLFSEARMRDHEVVIKKGHGNVNTFKKEKYGFNVNLWVNAGISLGYTRDKQMEKARTHEPQLIIHLTEKEAAAWLDRLILPKNIILTSAFEGLKSPRQHPTRNTWFAGVQFEDGNPAVDFRNNVQTRVTYWGKNSKLGIHLGGVSHKGGFHAPFSDAEMQRLNSGDAWLTMTVGTWSTAVEPDHPRLSAADLFRKRDEVKAVQVSRPGFRHGRILMKDGGPATLHTAPWPGAKIKVMFAYAGSIPVDEEGYFKVFLTDEQFEELKDKKTRRNIYIPYEDKKGRSSARFAFPVKKLSSQKENAGVVKIPHVTVK